LPLTRNRARRDRQECTAAEKVIPAKSVRGTPFRLDARPLIREADSGKSRRGGVMSEYTPYQRKVIQRYYDNKDTLAHQRLAELVSELYLAKGKKLNQAWEQAAAAMQKLKVPQAHIDHLLKERNPALVAELVKELEGTS